MTLRSVLLGFLLASTLGAQAPAPIQLVEYGSDLSIRDDLIEAGSFLGDLGRAGFARLDASAAADLVARGIAVESVPSLRPGERIVVSARTRSGAGSIHGRLLLARRAFFVSAAVDTDIPVECRGSGFHGGVQVLDVDRTYTAAPEIAARPQSLVQDPLIAAMVGQVQGSALQSHVQTLSGIFTRRATSADNAQAIQYVTGQLATIPNITFRTESFSASYGPNIIAELPGTDLAQEIVMVGAHIDSIVGGSATARSPGADDNASGSAAVLEMVRIMSGQQFRRTIRFAWWNAEEFGLVGSNAYAAAAATRGDAIVAYVNTDMNAYRAPGDTLSLDFVTNDSTTSLIDALTASAQTYVPGLTVNRGSLTGGTSDHRSFFRNGFAAAFPFEDVGQYSPLIHTSNDAIGSSANDFQLSELITKSVLAGIADLAEIGFANPGTFNRFGQACLGTGTTPSTCASNNENGGALSNLRRTNEYAYRVPGQGALQVEAFEVYSASTTGGPVTVGAYVYADAGGLPAPTPLAQTTVTIDGTPGFYRATLSSPVTVQGTFHLAVDHSAQTTYLATLGSGQSGSGSWRRPALSGAWSASGIISAPSFRVLCSGGGSRTSPSMGNDGVPIVGRSFALTLSQAAPGAVCALLIGTSDQGFGGIALPAPLPGAPGCSLLVAPERIDQRTADGAGAARVDLPVPGDPALIGFDVFHQWVVIDAGANALGLAVSEGARARIGG
jgi:hypothetical protein